MDYLRPAIDEVLEEKDGCESHCSSSSSSSRCIATKRAEKDSFSPTSTAGGSKGRSNDVVLDDVETDWYEVPEFKSVPLSEHEGSGSEDEVLTLDEEEERMAGDLPTSQWVFFIRHAESRWNKAQASKSLVGMFGERDHGLSEAGRWQAEALRRKLQAAKAHLEDADDRTMFGAVPVSSGNSVVSHESVTIDGWEDLLDRQPPPKTSPEQWLRMLLNPDKVCSSPFTRAISTAMIGFQDILQGKSLVLMREARERKILGGVDSTGIATGREIMRRVESDLNSVYKEEKEPSAVLQDMKSINVDYTDCMQRWWGGAAGDEKDLDRARTAACLRKLRRVRGLMPGGGGVSVLVSHSLFLKTIFQACLRPGELPADVPYAVNDALCSEKLPHAAVIGCRIEWDQDGRPSITEVQPVLGTVIKSPKFGTVAALDRGIVNSPDIPTAPGEDDALPDLELDSWDLCEAK